MLNYLYSGELNLEKYESFKNELSEEIKKISSQLDFYSGNKEYFQKGDSEQGLFYVRNKELKSLPKIIFSLTKQKFVSPKKDFSHLIFKNGISWEDYNCRFNDFYILFAEAHENLFRFYKAEGIKHLSTWSEWNKEEEKLFLEKDLNLLYAGNL